MKRKLALILAAILLPGGFIALFAAVLFKALTRSERGRKVVALAKQRVPRLYSSRSPLFVNEQAA
ncbi:MAG: hypothetical protein ACJ79W_10780 [Myxococcales bacterium]